MNSNEMNAGFVEEIRNPFLGEEAPVVIYVAEEQGLDAEGGKYVVVCDAHATLCNATSKKDARWIMKNPDLFCIECREALEGEEA